MKSFSTTTSIQAPAETIWAILCDTAQWPAWNPTVVKVEGTIALGETLALFTQSKPNRAFVLTVSEYIPHQRMVLSGGMPLGLFSGTRTYTLTPQTDGPVQFTMGEVFSGLLSPVFGRAIPDLQPSFDEFAAALKHRAESSF